MPLQELRVPPSLPRYRRRKLVVSVASALVLLIILLASGGSSTDMAQGAASSYPTMGTTPLHSSLNKGGVQGGIQPATRVSLRVSPEIPWARPGETVTFALYAEGDVAASGAEVTLSYGPDLELLGVTPGPYLGQETIAAPALQDQSRNQATYAWARIGDTPSVAPPGELVLVTMKAAPGRPWNSWVTARVRLVDGSFRKLQEATLSFDLHVYDRVPAPIPILTALGAPGSYGLSGPRPLLGVKTLSPGTFKYRIEVSQDRFQTVLHTFDQTTSPEGWDREEYRSGNVAEFKPSRPLDPGVYQWRAYVWVQEIGRWSAPSKTGQFWVRSQSMGLSGVRPGVVRSINDDGTAIALEGWGFAPDARVSLAAPGGPRLPASIHWLGDSTVKVTLPPDTSPGLALVKLSRLYRSDLIAPVLVLPRAWFTVQTILPWASQVVPGKEFWVRTTVSNLGAGADSVAVITVQLPDHEVFQLVGVKADRGGQILEQGQDRVLLSVAGGSVVDFKFRLPSEQAPLQGGAGQGPVAPGNALDFDFDPLVLGVVSRLRWGELESLPLPQRVQALQREADEESRRIARTFNETPLEALASWSDGLSMDGGSEELVKELLRQLQGHGLDLERIASVIPGPLATADGSMEREDQGRPFVGGNNECCQHQPHKLHLVSSSEPGNFLAYPQTAGGKSYIARDQPVSYSIRFENPAEAREPVADVRVMAQLDTAVDLESLRTGSVSHPRGMSIELDQSTNTVTWSFKDVNLLPNRGPPEGEGRIEFSARLHSDVPAGSVVKGRAAVMFGSSPPVATNDIAYTVDADPPDTRVRPMAPVQLDPSFPVFWEGADEEGGSGIGRTALLASRNGGPFEVVGKTHEPSFDFRGEPGATYGFATVAIDRVGHVEAAPSAPDVTVTVGQRLSYTGGFYLLGIPVFTEQGPPEVLEAPGGAWTGWDSSRQAYFSGDGSAAGGSPGVNYPGRGWWVQFEKEASVLISGPAAPYDRPFSINIHPGWNLVASPFTAAVPWSLDNILARSGGVEKTLREARQAGWVEDYAWGWDGDAYSLVYDSAVLPGVASSLEPFQGYWVQAHRDLTLVLPPPH